MNSLRILKEHGMTEAALGVDTENTSGGRCGSTSAAASTVRTGGAIYRKPLGSR